MLGIVIMLLGLMLGFLAGLAAPLVPTATLARYLSIAVIASLDTAFGGIRAGLEGKYNNVIFVSGFFTNIVLAAGLVYLGDLLGVRDLYLAGVVAMGVRVFQNIGIIRRKLLERWGLLNFGLSSPGEPPRSGCRRAGREESDGQLAGGTGDFRGVCPPVER